MSPSPVRVRSAVLSVLLIALATWVYYVIPVPSTLSRDSWAVMFFSGAGVLGILIITAIQRLLRAGEDARIRGLVLLLTLTVLFFSWADLSVSKLPSQFAELQTKTDSLYFNVSTLATVTSVASTGRASCTHSPSPCRSSSTWCSLARP